MSDKPVTVGQVAQVRKIANEKHFGRRKFEKALNDGTFARFLDALKVGDAITFGPLQMIPPLGGQIRRRKVSVDFEHSWYDAVNHVCGDEGGNGSPIWAVERFFSSPSRVGKVEENTILLNFPYGDGSWEKAITWAKQHKLRHTNPRHVFAIGKDYPTFDKDVGLDSTYVVATEAQVIEGCFQACGVWWCDGKQGVSLRRTIGHTGRDIWFVFLEPHQKELSF